MSQSSPPQTLDDLLFRAEEFAGFSRRARGKVPPAPLTHGHGGPLFFVLPLSALIRDIRGKIVSWLV